MKKMLLNSKSGSLWVQLAVFVAAILMTAQVKAENVAQIVGGGSYATVQSAINAAQSGQTVKMLANSTENITVTPGKKLTLDLNGKLLQGTGSGSVITVQAEGSLTFSDSGEDTHCFVEGSDGSWTWSNSLASGNFKTIPAAGAVVAVEGSTLRAGKGLLGNLKTLEAKYGNSKAVFAMFDDINDHIAYNNDVKARRVKAAADYGTPLVDDNPLPTQEDKSNEMWFLKGYCDFDVRGIHSGNEIKTTYANQGYEHAFKIDNGYTYTTYDDDSYWQLGKVYTYSGIQIKQHISLIDNGQLVKFGYTIHNNTDAVHTVWIGNHTDVQIGDNDAAGVYLTNAYQRISMTDDHTGDCTSKGLKYTIDADQDSPFNGAWIGYWSERHSWYFHTPSSTEDKSYTGHDSGITFHWKKTLQPGQTTQVWCYFQIAPALVIEAVNLTADAETNKVLFDIPYKDLKDRTQTLYYTLENNPQRTKDGSTVGLPVDGENFAHSSFTFSDDVTGWPSNTMRRIDLYANDNAGYTSKYYTFYIWWPEWSPEKSYSIVSFKNTVNKFADVRGEVGSAIMLPEDASEEGAKEFIGWNTEENGGGTGYKAGDSYTFTDNDIVLYAQWKYAADRLTYINEDQYYTGAPIEKIKVKYGTQTLTPGVDYNIVYENNINVGTATATVSGGKILGTQVLNFKIMKNTNVVPPTLPGQPYTGGPQIADIVDTDLYKVTVNEGGTEITPEGEDGYPVIISLKDPTQSTWSDGTTEPKTIYFKIVTGQVQLPEIASKPWTGELQTADITDTDTYTVTANAGGTEVGSYIVKVDLKDKTKFKWSNGSTEEQTLTFNITKVSVPVPEVASKVYNAAVQTADVTVTSQFTVTQNAGGTDAGTYDVKLKLTDEAFVHYKWANTDNQETTVDFIITKADNEWITEPSIADVEVNTSAVVTPVYEAKYGTPEITYTGINGKAYGPSSTEPTELGDYRATFKVENANYSTLTKYVDFSIYQLVCAIGDTKYKSVKVASEDVLAGESIKLLLDCNIIEGSTVTLPLGAMIDLNGKTLTNDGTIQVDMTGAAENKYKVITGKTPLTAADCGNVVAANTPDGKTYVPIILDNELFLVNKGTLDLGAFDWDTFTFKDATGTEGLTYSQFMIMLTKEIDLNKVIANHTLELPNVAGYTKNASLSSEYTYVIDLATPATAKQIAEYMKQVKFRNITTDQQVRVVIGDKTDVKTFYFSDTQHYYQYIPYTGSKTWIAAYNEAKSKTFANRQGYLATVMTLNEDVFIYKAASNVGWLGGTHLAHGTKNGMYYDSFNTSGDAGNWYWACGPECGTVFLSKTTATATTSYADEKNKGYYFNWGIKNEPNEGEPNGGTDEQCLTTLRTGKGYSTQSILGSSVNYSWNDIAWDRNDNDPTYQPTGYFVEFGNKLIGDTSDSGSVISIDCSIVAEKAITPRTLTGITADSYNGKYDGMNHNITLEGTEATDVLEYSVDGINYSTNIASAGLKDACEAATSYIRVTREGYYRAPITGTVTITMRDVTMTSGDAIKYGNLSTPLQCKQVTVSGEGFVAGEGATYDNFASQLGIGSCDNTFDYTLKSNTKAINYNITKVYGTLTVDGVCRIGDDYYNTIDLAIEAVKPGETIILLTNITMKNSLQLPAGTGLDLNGFTLTDPTGLDLSWDLTKDVAPVVFDFDKLAANGTLTLNVNDQQTLSQYTLAKDAAGATGKQFILKGAATADGKDRVLEVGADKKMFYGHRFYSLALDGTDIVLTVEKVKPQNFEFWGVSVDGTQLALTSDVNYNATHVRDDFYPEDAITHFIFDGDITRIGRYCLENNLNLKEVYFPEVTDYVSLNAFNGCENLEYVSTGEGLVEINDRAFHGCTKLNTIDIADNAELKEIAEEAFAGTGFVTMTLPASVEYIGSRTFFGAKNLESVTLCGTDPSKINMTHESFKKDNDGTLPAASIFVVSDKLLPFEAYYYGKGINFQTKYERLYSIGILQLGFFSHHNFIVPEGLEAYAATWDGRSFVLSTTTATAGEVLEGGHGYIFMGAEGTYTFETTAKEPTFTFAANDLIGSPEEVTAKDPLKLGRVFVVNNGSTFDSLVEVTDPAQKIDACHPFAIITPNNAPAVKYFDFDNWYNGWATGVQSPSESTANSDEPTYNVAGQRISSSYKGIVIQNGKKQLNK